MLNSGHTLKIITNIFIMKDKQAERKHRKSLVRKKIVSEKKKSKLSDEMMIQAMQNMEILETQRRIAILEFLAAE